MQGIIFKNFVNIKFFYVSLVNFEKKKIRIIEIKDFVIGI